MIYTLKFLNKDVFNYDTHNDDLTCSYCNCKYMIQSSKLKFKISEMIKSSQFDIETILVRCIHCDLYSETYPFKFSKSDHVTFKPNDEQNGVIENLYQEILITSHNDDTRQLCLVEGQAGTGKTSMITYLLSYPEFQNYDVCFAAPTNIALNVLMNKLQSKDDDNNLVDSSDGCENNDNKIAFKTVFKLLDNKMTISSQTGETQFNYNSDSQFRIKHEITVIDEVSMVDKKALDQIFGSVANTPKHGGFVPIIIFLGDEGQLPPVKEETSIIFDKKIQSKYQIKRLVLTKIMRSQDKLLDLSVRFRNLIPMDMNEKMHKDMHGINLKKIVGKQINYFNNRSQWINCYVKDFKEYLKELTSTNQKDKAPIMLSYTNPECDSLNITTRDLIFDNPEEKYVKGESLVFNKNYSISRQRKLSPTKPKESYFLKFYTSNPIIIDDVVLSEVTIPLLQLETIFRSPTNIIEKMTKKITSTTGLSKSLKENLIDAVTKIITSWKLPPNEAFIGHDGILDKYLNRLCKKISIMKHRYDIYQLSIANSDKLDPFDTDRDNCSITVIRDDSIDLYKSQSDEIKKLIRSSFNELMTVYRTNTNMKWICEYLFQQIWLIYYYRTYVWPFADIVYGYAMTTHKSQGSTYPNVYLNISNILGCNKVSTIVKFKSLYTGGSRPSKFANILYQTPILLPGLPSDCKFKCHYCGSHNDSQLFSPVNCTYDKKCSDDILLKLKSTTLYLFDQNFVVLSDKNKNLYQIPIDKLPDQHINDAYTYISENDLVRCETDKYQYSNIILGKKVLETNLLA